MIISKTPHRISFFGGGTDYPPYYLKHGGKVLGVGIDKYSYINIRKLPPFFDHKYRIVYSKQENVEDIESIVHPSVRETLRYFGVDYGISIHHDGDIPARSGMGSSSAFTVGLVKSLHALEGKMISKGDLAKTAIHIEQNLIKEHVGSQDQAFAAYGGLNMIEFLPSGEIVVNPIILPSDRLREFEGSLMLFFTGISRIASEVAKDQIEKTEINEPSLHAMKQLVDDAFDILTSNKDLRLFGEMLNETWRLKRSLSGKISSPEIDEMYETAMSAGTLGGKLLGAGGGGFMLFFVPNSKQESVKQALKNYLHIPFGFDFGGSEIIVYEPNH
jgi:D-glycero-alpha-D-manno-heptose-7-phosphate kinase